MRSFAVGSTSGARDNWVSNSYHNAMFYHRPTDNKVVFFLHDLDYYNASSSLKQNSILRAITTLTTWNHQFYGYVHDFIETSFNGDYLKHWAAHYHDLLPEQSWTTWHSYFASRQRNVQQQLDQVLPAPLEFRVVSHVGGLLQGEGWINVLQMRIQETGDVLAPVWDSLTSWQAMMPAGLTVGTYTLGAYDSQGVQVGLAPVQVTP
jgi:hypothetical protein